MEYAQRIGARIARLRTEKHLTQGQLAQAAGVPRDALARWEAGGGLPGRAELTALARPLGTTAAALLNADEDEPDEAPVGFLTFPRTEQAWRAQARCMRGSGPRTAYALAALCCTVCAALSRAWLFGSVRMACTGFFLAAAAFCLWGCADGPLRLRLRAACKGDFAAVQAAVYPTHCRWHQNGEPYRLEHADLMGAWELPDGFVLQWEGPPLFVHHSDAQAVRYILSRSYGVPYRVLRPRREPFWALCACTAGLAISLWLSGGGLRLLRQSFAPSAPLPDAPQSAAVPDFSSTNGPCFAAADGGVTWFGQSLTALDRPVEYAKLEFLTPELGFAAVGTQHSPGGGEEKYAFFTHNGGQSWTAFGALPHFGTSHILSGFSMTPDGTAFLTLATGPEENWPLLYCSADGGASWQTAELPWDDCALAYLNHLSRAEQRPEGFYVLLTQLPYSGGNAAFFAPTAQGPWSYAGDAIPDA